MDVRSARPLKTISTHLPCSFPFSGGFSHAQRIQAAPIAIRLFEAVRSFQDQRRAASESQ